MLSTDDENVVERNLLPRNCRMNFCYGDVFEIRLRGRFGAILKGIKILMNIFGTQFQGGTVKIQGRQMTAFNGTFAFTLNGHAAVETVIERFKAVNLFDSTCYKVISRL